MKLPKITNKALKITLIVVGILLFLIILLSVLESPIAKSYIEKHSVELIGRQITMDKLRVNIFNASVKIEGCHISEQDLKTDFIYFDTLKVAIRPFKLISKEVNIRYITLAGPDIKIINEGERFNFTDLLELGDTTDTDTTASEWAIGIYNINLHSGRITYTDRSMNNSWGLKNIKIAIPGLYFGGQATNAGISLQLADGGTLRTDAKYDADNEKYQLDLNLDKVALKNAEPFAKDLLNGMKALKGTLSGKVNVNGSLENIADLDIAGSLNLNNVAVDMDNGQLASLKKLALKINRINPAKNIFDFSSINLDGLNSHFDIYADGSTNFSNLTKSNSQADAADTSANNTPDKKNDTTATPSSPMVLKVGALEIADINITFNDYSMATPFTYPVTNIRMSTENFVLGDQEKALMLRAQLPNAGSVVARWKGGMSLNDNQWIYLSLKNVTLKNFSPYTLHYLAYPIKEGVLSFTSENSIRNSQLNGKNKIDIYNLNVEKKRRDLKPEYNIPLRTALYILKDKDDKIQIDLPIKGDVNSPEFSYRKIIFKTLGNLLVKVALSPMNFVASNLGLSPDELSYIDINLFQRDLTSEQYEKLSRLADILKADPDMTMTLEQNIDYQTAAKELPMYEMKRLYYLSQNPEKQGKPLTSLDITSINEIKDKDKAFRSFAEDQLSSFPGNLEQKLDARFPTDTIDARIRRLMEMRNKQVNHFLVEKMEVSQEQIAIKSIDLNTLKKEKHNSR
ncbi:MAG: DUF748 domain-containing protein, partial [Bacteroidales bacterium]|nr:DUF748 domain-containing protein [Bacteroidales bacterium]